MSINDIHARVRAVREALLAGYEHDANVAEALGCSVRTLRRLPVQAIKIGRRRYTHVESCKAALIARANPPLQAA